MTPGHSTSPSGEQIERMQQRRTRIMTAMGVLFVVWQGNYLSLSGSADRLVDRVRVAGYVVWVVALLGLLATGGAYWRDRAVREILNDETTRAFRMRALASGFWVGMTVALACYIASFFWALTGREVVHLVLSGGIATALFAFAGQERRALRDARDA